MPDDLRGDAALTWRAPVSFPAGSQLNREQGVDPIVLFLRLEADPGVVVLWGCQPSGVCRMSNARAGQQQEDEAPEDIQHYFLRELKN